MKRCNKGGPIEIASVKAIFDSESYGTFKADDYI